MGHFFFSFFDLQTGETKAKVRTLGDKCVICNNKVYLLERHVEEGKLYHRSCYRHSDLSPTHKVYTHSPFLSPSLRGKDASSTQTSTTSKSSSSTSSSVVSSLDQASDVRKTYVVDKGAGEKSDHGVKKGLFEKNKKGNVQKSLFHHDKHKTPHKPADVHKSDDKESKSTSHDSQSKDRPGSLHVAALHDKGLAASDSVLSPTPKFDARGFEKHNLDFLSAEKEAVDAVKTPKRQLPLIFQNAGGNGDATNDSVASVTSNIKRSDVNSHSAGGRTVHAVDSHAKTPDDKHESLSTSEIGVYGHKDKTSAVLGAKYDESSTVSESKHTGPVARPRHGVLGKKVLDTNISNVVLRKTDKSDSSQPKPAPRTSHVPSDVQTNKVKSPEAARKAPPRPKSGIKSAHRDTSPEPSAPPPLPLSAPPPLSLSIPSSGGAHPLPSRRHLPSSASHDTVQKEKPTDSSHAKKTAESHPARPSRLQSASSALLGKDSSSGKNAGVSSRLHSTPSALTSVSDMNSNSEVPASRPPPLASHGTVSHTSVTSKTAESTGKPSGTTTTTTSVFTSKTTINMPSNKRQEEPMDVDTAFSKARAQYGEEPVAVLVSPVDTQQDKSTLTGLLKSLAHVRNTPSASAAATTASSAAHTTTSAQPSDKPDLKMSTPASVAASEPQKVASTGFVSSKLSQLPKDAEHRPGSAPRKGHVTSTTLSTTDVHINVGTDKSAQKDKHVGDSTHPHSKTKISDKKIGEGVTLTLDLANKTVEENNKEATAAPVISNGKHTSKAPSWKTQLAELYAEDKPELVSKDHADTALHVPSKSGGDAQSVAKTTPAFLKHKATTPDALESPAFVEVKLRKSGDTTLERKERAKSAGSALEAEPSKPIWQLEAERRMAAMRSSGFVDPETKKVIGSNENIADDEKAAPGLPVRNSTAAGVVVDVKESVASSHVTKPAPKADAKQEREKVAVTVKTETKVKVEPKHPLKSILKKEDVDALEVKAAAATPPSKPQRLNLHTNKQYETETTPSAVKTSTPKDKSPQGTANDAGPTAATRKKLNVSDIVSDNALSPPPRPSSPPKVDRKKISVDINFDFDASNSVEVTPAKPHDTSKLTPPVRPPPPRNRNSVSILLYLFFLSFFTLLKIFKFL
jgi:hypothetical protein